MAIKSPPVTGLHGPVYVAPELVQAALLEASCLAIRNTLGDKISALEMLGLLLLKSAGRL